MKKTLLLFALFIATATHAQTINFPDANFKAKLLSADETNYVATNGNYESIRIDTDFDGEIQVAEVENVRQLDLKFANISDLTGIANFYNMFLLDCSNNNLSFLDVHGMVNLQFLVCHDNALSLINVQGATLLGIDCSDNQLSSIDLQGLPVTDFRCSGNQFTNLDFLNGFNLSHLVCNQNQLTALDAQQFPNLMHLEFSNNQISSINVQGLTILQDLYCSYNQLSSLDVHNLPQLSNLVCDHNNIPSLNLQGVPLLGQLGVSDNPIASLDLHALPNLWWLLCRNNQLTSLDLNGLSKLEGVFCSGNQLTTINAKCGNTQWQTFSGVVQFDFSGNPNIEYICADEEDVAMVQQKINTFGYTNTCHVNSYCSFAPGGTYYTIGGTNRFDENTNGCDASDIAYPNLKINISNGTMTGGLITDTSGNYEYNVQAGTYTLTPELENPSYFSVSPSTPVSFTFPTQTSPVNQSYCITPVGIHHDLEISIIPTTSARPGFDSNYKIIYKNKGNQTETASITFSFDDAVLDFVSSTVAPTTQSSGSLGWNLGTVTPFQSGEITVKLNLNSPVETPPLNGGDLLHFTASINGINTDEAPADNTFALPQTVVNSFDPNDKTCLEGSILDTSMIGQYVHYMIRFENTGTFAAENIVVKDMIDTSKFDIASLQMTSASHTCITRIAGNKVEFVFEGINLPFDDANNDGYVVFKIKTLPTLTNNSTISNSASIYFDYNAPINTDPAVSTIAALSNPDFNFSSLFVISPNPVKNTLNITAKQDLQMNSISIYNVLGQLMLTVSNPNNTLDISDLKTGNYIIKVSSDKGVGISKFIKE